jgi:hypothetical protein
MYAASPDAVGFIWPYYEGDALPGGGKRTAN